MSDEDIPLVTRALEHFHAYLVATQRQDPRYLELAERLKRKPPEREESTAVNPSEDLVQIRERERPPLDADMLLHRHVNILAFD